MRVDRRTLFAATLAAAAAGSGAAGAQNTAAAPLSRIAPPASGSTLFALADDDTAARVLADEFARQCGPDMTIRIVRVLSTSPMVDATGG